MIAMVGGMFFAAPQIASADNGIMEMGKTLNWKSYVIRILK